MSCIHKGIALLFGLSLCCAHADVLNAQEDLPRTGSRVQPADQISTTGITSPAENDRRIARWLIIDQQAVIECCKMAQERTSNENVKRFAQTMLNEHNTCLEKLERVRGQSNASETDRPANSPVTRIEQAQVDPKNTGIVIKDDGRQRDGKMIYRAADFLQVKEEICNHMKSVMMKEWKPLSSADFDRAFMKHMVAGHEMLLASCKAVRKTASNELQTMLDQDMEKLAVHLKQTRELCDQVCGTTSTGSLKSKDDSKLVR